MARWPKTENFLFRLKPYLPLCLENNSSRNKIRFTAFGAALSNKTHKTCRVINVYKVDLSFSIHLSFESSANAHARLAFQNEKKSYEALA